MKIFDCITYYDEPMLFEVRLNILNKFVDKFVVVESLYTHSGKKKKSNFDKSKYPNFTNKIIHFCLKDDVNNLLQPEGNNRRENSIKRISHQRDSIREILSEINEDDWVIYSDSDEIPNLNNVDFQKLKDNIIFFEQKLCYYKFNLHLPTENWFGSRAVKFKNLSTISNLRNSKPKIYNWWRLDTLFSNLKHQKVKIVKNGGWHFSDLKSIDDIFKKKQNDEHHDEFEDMKIDKNKIKDMVNNKYITYNHKVDKKETKKRWNNKIKLINLDSSQLPKYIIDNKIKYLNWFDK